MATEPEDLRVIKQSEELADRIWSSVKDLSGFERNTIGEQLVRSADSVGANIAEGNGRYHYGEKIGVLYYARGSLAGTKYWFRRARQRKLLTEDLSSDLLTELEAITKQINRFISDLQRQSKSGSN